MDTSGYPTHGFLYASADRGQEWVLSPEAPERDWGMRRAERTSGFKVSRDAPHSCEKNPPSSRNRCSGSWQAPAHHPGPSAPLHTRGMHASNQYHMDTPRTAADGLQALNTAQSHAFSLDAHTYPSVAPHPTFISPGPSMFPVEGTLASRKRWSPGPPTTANSASYVNSLTYALGEPPRSPMRDDLIPVEGHMFVDSASTPVSDDDLRGEPSASAGPEGRNKPRARTYACQLCGKAFVRPSALATHANVHTGEQPFPCTVPGCDRRFSVQSNARRHALTHGKKDGARGGMIAFQAPMVAHPPPMSPMPPFDVKWADEK